MQEKYLFEYAVIRVVPHVDREEFLNVGVVLYCSKEKFLESVFELNEERLNIFCGKLDIPELKEYIASFEKICKGGSDSGPIGKLPAAERFRWLTAARSTVLQTSNVHPGLSDDASATLKHLYVQLVQKP